jgi:hypothetical protein
MRDATSSKRYNVARASVAVIAGKFDLIPNVPNHNKWYVIVYALPMPTIDFGEFVAHFWPHCELCGFLDFGSATPQV